jgi:hypothetical protein
MIAVVNDCLSYSQVQARESLSLVCVSIRSGAFLLQPCPPRDRYFSQGGKWKTAISMNSALRIEEARVEGALRMGCTRRKFNNLQPYLRK